MALTGKQKVAMLLMGLDAVTAAELLKDVDSEVVKELAVELAYLDAAGLRDNKQIAQVTQQFCSSLQTREEFHIKDFLSEMLKSTVGNEKAEQIQTQIQGLLQKRDPFIPIRSVNSPTLASILENEHPQATAVVLSELEPKKSSGILGLLSESIQISVISRMAGSESITSEARTRIAETICNRLESSMAAGGGGPVPAQAEQSLRKVAVILRNLGKELRVGLIGAIQEKDSNAVEKITNLMILWEDIPQIADKSLQEALRGVDTQKLALALVKADEAITEKIRANISERAVATIDEETSLMSAPKKEDIKQVREEIVTVLRNMNEKGELAFTEE